MNRPPDFLDFRDFFCLSQRVTGEDLPFLSPDQENHITGDPAFKIGELSGPNKVHYLRLYYEHHISPFLHKPVFLEDGKLTIVNKNPSQSAEDLNLFSYLNLNSDFCIEFQDKFLEKLIKMIRTNKERGGSSGTEIPGQIQSIVEESLHHLCSREPASISDFSREGHCAPASSATGPILPAIPEGIIVENPVTGPILPVIPEGIVVENPATGPILPVTGGEDYNVTKVILCVSLIALVVCGYYYFKKSANQEGVGESTLHQLGFFDNVEVTTLVKKTSPVEIFSFSNLLEKTFEYWSPY